MIPIQYAPSVASITLALARYGFGARWSAFFVCCFECASQRLYNCRPILMLSLCYYDSIYESPGDALVKDSFDPGL